MTGFLVLKPYVSCQIMTPKGTPRSSSQLRHENIIIMSENTQYARLITLTPESPKLEKRRPSAGAASITCIDDRVKETLANTKSRGAAAASTYGMVDQ